MGACGIFRSLIHGFISGNTYDSEQKTTKTMIVLLPTYVVVRNKREFDVSEISRADR